MADSLKSLVVGNTFVGERRSRNSPPYTTQMTVTKVGRKYLYASVQNGWSNLKFNIDTGVECESHYPMYGYLTEESHQQEVELRELQTKASAASRQLSEFGGRLIYLLSREDALTLIAIAERAKAGRA